MGEEFYVRLGNSIRQRRTSIGMTQATLAERASLSRTTVTNIERGGQALLVHQLSELAQVLGTKPESLIQASAAPAKPNSPLLSPEFEALLARLDGKTPSGDT